MIDLDTTLKHTLFEITIGHGIADVEEDRVQNDGFGIMDAFEINDRNAKSSFHILAKEC